MHYTDCVSSIRVRLLEIAYICTSRILHLFRRWLGSGGVVEKGFILLENVTKRPVFGCQMCGQCVLHNTGMTCPMNCPKNLRNGPCGGVRVDGNCEILPKMECVWVKAWNRSRKMAVYAESILEIQPPLNRSLKGSSAWINDMTGRDKENSGRFKS